MPEQLLGRGDRMHAYLEREVWPFIPPKNLGRHPARLNFGDCLICAYAAVHKLALAYKGIHFGLTALPLLHRLDA